MTTDRDHVLRRARVLLSVQRALLGAVTPPLRGVAVAWDDAAVEIVCYFDGPISKQSHELMSEVQTEVLADLAEGEDVRLTCEQRDAPAELEPMGTWVYRRHEIRPAPRPRARRANAARSARSRP